MLRWLDSARVAWTIACILIALNLAVGMFAIYVYWQIFNSLTGR